MDYILGRAGALRPTLYLQPYHNLLIYPLPQRLITLRMRCPEIVNHSELEQKLNERQGLVTKWPEVGLVEICNGIVSM